MRTDGPSSTAAPHERRVTIVSDELPEHLARLCSALEQRHIMYALRSATASAPMRTGVAYVRRIDSRLGDESAFVRVAALAAKPAFTVNTPGSVRIAEWSPLAVHALRDHRVPQPARLWCLDESDLPRAVDTLGMPLVMEGVVTRRRVLATTTRELDEAFAEAAGHHRNRGALAESPVRARTAELTAMVVDGESIPAPGQAHAEHLRTRPRIRSDRRRARGRSNRRSGHGGRSHHRRRGRGVRDANRPSSAHRAPQRSRARCPRSGRLAPPARTPVGAPCTAPGRIGRRRRAPRRSCMGGAWMLGGNRHDAEIAPPRPQPGFRLTYHGSDIGVIERVEPAGAAGPAGAMLYVRGGISGALRYAIPADAVTRVMPDERRVNVSDGITFEPEAVGKDGEVLLIAHTPQPHPRGNWRPNRAIPRTSRGFRVYADNGYLGEVETTLGATADAVDFIVIRARHWLRTRHPVLPTRYVVECEPLDGIIVVAGDRRELRRLPELPKTP